LIAVLSRALTDSRRGLGALAIDIEPEALAAIAAASDGDARRALDNLDSAVRHAKQRDLARITLADLEGLVSRRELQHDKSGERITTL